jgi:hypothetical protein
MTRGIAILLLIVGLILWFAVPEHWGGVDFNVNTCGAVVACVAGAVLLIDLFTNR